ncbi:MAG TPA: OmpA family protein [Thermoanaerobaculia bacterium]|jgi:outer membrane protein OmpA-like peptidoglycan-associated protein
MRKTLKFLPIVLGVLAAACSAGPPPREIAEARLAVQDAKNANADQLAAREYDAAIAHLRVAENTWTERKDGPLAAHWARVAEGEARTAQYRAEARNADEAVRRETERKRQGELSVRDAEIGALQARARTEAEKRAAEAEARAAAERRAAEDRLASQEAAAREREQARLDLEARLAAERSAAEREAAARTQAERERASAELGKTRAELEASRKAAEDAQRSAEAERRRLEEQRKAEADRTAQIAQLQAEQQKTQEELRRTLSALASVREEARGLIVTLPGSIYFDVNKSDVKPAMRARIIEIARALAKVPGQRVLVEGHTDSDGPSEYNLQLSRLRAQSVRSALIEGGVSPDRIEAQGYGETRPVATNGTAAGKAQNRRVELVLEGGAATPK